MPCSQDDAILLEINHILCLLQAAEFPAGSFERLIHVACFAVSGYASTAKRTSKPFNPLLGETYEFVCPEKGFRFISEKVRQAALPNLVLSINLQFAASSKQRRTLWCSCRAQESLIPSVNCMCSILDLHSITQGCASPELQSNLPPKFGHLLSAAHSAGKIKRLQQLTSSNPRIDGHASSTTFLQRCG